tara:strand:+ start:76513 stop:78456 length:1944 start_codon:yes stop_codon:yes gene_type:complete
MTTQVQFGLPVSGLLENSSEDFLDSVVWRESEMVACGNKDSNFNLRTIGMCWKRQCLDRCPAKLQTGQPRFTTLDGAVESAEAGSIFAVLGRARRETVPSKRPPKGNLRKQAKSNSHLSREAVELLRLWLTSSTVEAEESPSALLAACELLALYGSQFPAEVIGGLWRATLAAALAQSESCLEAAATEDWQDQLDQSDKAGATWLKAGLLPLVCGLLFDDVKGAPRLSRAGRVSLNDQLLHVTDGDGVPVCEVLDALPEFLALWSDGLLMSQVFGETLWKKSASRRFEKMLSRLAATVRASETLTGCANGEASLVALKRAVELAGLPSPGLMSALGTASTGNSSATKATTKKSKRNTGKKRAAKTAIPSWQSDDTETACLRTSWAVDASLATVRSTDEPVQLELAVDGVPLLSGAWRLEIAEGGEFFELEAEWECICWNSDSDGDYFELQLEFEGGPMINRYLYLSRSDRFAIIADVVSGAKPGRVDLATMLPLADGVTLEAGQGGREQLLKAGDRNVRVYPLGLPQDPGMGTVGKIGLDEDEAACLTSSHATESGTMFAPIVLDWAPERQSLPAEWRKLTVTRAGEIDHSGGAAFRLQVGKLHLVLYRSLGGTERYRTFLGYQAESETVIGKFTKSGVIQELLIVE